MRNIAIIFSLTALAGCVMATVPGYETTEFHANGTPVSPEERAEREREHKQECPRLYLLLGDPSLSPAEIQEIRLKRAAIFCFGEGA